MLDIDDDPVQVLAVDGNDIKVFGKLYRTIGIDDKLHRHLFLVTALPRPLLGWDFLRAHHAVIFAAPEQVHFRCECNNSGGPIRKLQRWPPTSRPIRRFQPEKKTVLSSLPSLNKRRNPGIVHSDFTDPRLQSDQQKRSSRDRRSNHLQLLSRNLDSTTTSTTGPRATSRVHRLRATAHRTTDNSKQGPPADREFSCIHGYATDDQHDQATDEEPDHPSQATDDEPDKPVRQATDEQTRRSSRGVALPHVRPRQAQFAIPTPKGSTRHCVARVDVVKRILQDFNDIACNGIPTIKPKHGFEHHIETKGQLLSL